MKLIVGLGNPGKEFERTRHNVGFRVIDRLAERAQDSGDLPWQKKYEGLFRKVHLGNDSVILLKPQTMMNASDESAIRFKRWFHIQLDEVWIVLDDVDLPLGDLRIRKSGSSAGHKGLASILERLGSENVPRFRIGIRGEGPIYDTADYVLKPFTRDEETVIENAITTTADTIEVALGQGFRAAVTTIRTDHP